MISEVGGVRGGVKKIVVCLLTGSVSTVISVGPNRLIIFDWLILFSDSFWITLEIGNRI